MKIENTIKSFNIYLDEYLPTKQQLKKLKEKHGIEIFYNGSIPIMLIARDKDKPNIKNIMVFGHEDDDHIWFNKNSCGYDNAIHVNYIDSIIKILKKIKKQTKWEEIC